MGSNLALTCRSVTDGVERQLLTAPLDLDIISQSLFYLHYPNVILVPVPQNGVLTDNCLPY